MSARKQFKQIKSNLYRIKKNTKLMLFVFGDLREQLAADPVHIPVDPDCLQFLEAELTLS